MRVLLVRTDRLGDVILSTPVATLLKLAHPDAQVHMLVRAAVAPLVRLHQDVDQVLELPDRSGLTDLVHLFRADAPDAVVLLHPTFELALAAWLARIPRRIGTRYRAYSFLLNERVPVHRKRSGKHELELNVDTAAPLGLAEIEAARPLFRFRIPAEVEERAAARLRELGAAEGERGVVLHPGSGGSARDWPVRRFAELARLVHGAGLGPIWVTGTAREKSLVDELERLSGVPLRRLEGRLNLPELAAVLKHARAVVANSTGPLHLAVAVGTPVVGLYCPIGPCHPRRWGPYGRPDAVLVPPVPECDRCTESCVHYDCMLKISAEQVFEKLQDIVEKDRPAEPS